MIVRFCDKCGEEITEPYASDIRIAGEPIDGDYHIRCLDPLVSSFRLGVIV